MKGYFMFRNTSMTFSALVVSILLHNFLACVMEPLPRRSASQADSSQVNGEPATGQQLSISTEIATYVAVTESS